MTIQTTQPDPSPETTPGFEGYSPRRWLSVSSLCSFSRCERNFFYSSGLRLRSLEDSNLALVFGSAIHAGLGHLVDGHDVPTAMREFAHVWKDLDSHGDTKRNSARASMMFASFAGHVRTFYTASPKVVLAEGLKTRNSSYEVPFAIDIGCYRQLPDGQKEMIPLVGWIDQVVLSKIDGAVGIAEYKTASEVSKRFFEGFSASPQLVAYVTALRTSGLPVPRVYLTALRVSEKNTETQTQIFNITDQQCDDFISWARHTGNMILAHEEIKTFPKDISSCYPYAQFGSQGYMCRYFDLCHRTSDWRQLASMFTKSPDDTFVLFEE